MSVLGPEVGYIDLLNHETTELLKREEEGKSKYTPIRPSASGKCTRELYYQLMEYHGYAKYPKELKKPDTHRLLNLGHSIEYHLVKQFELLADFFAIRYKQQVLSFKYFKAKNPKHSQWLEGSLDLVFWSEKYKCVADVKSKGGGWDFKARKSRWDSTSDKLQAMSTVKPLSDNAYWVENLEDFLDELDDPFFAANFTQLNMYANSEFLKERGIDHGAIIQYHKQDSKLREVRFKPSKALYEKTLKKFGKVIEAVDTGNEALATRDYAADSFKCRYCDFRKTCWSKK